MKAIAFLLLAACSSASVASFPEICVEPRSFFVPCPEGSPPLATCARSLDSCLCMGYVLGDAGAFEGTCQPTSD